MDNFGFYIKQFEARGGNVVTSTLTFKKGCNVILGKSDTGKTTLFKLIEYVLGKSTQNMSLPPEGQGYTDFFIEIETYNEEVFTLKRSLNSNNIFVSPCTISAYETCLKHTEYSCQSNSNISLSDFLLRISNIPTIKSKLSQYKNPTKISFPILRHFFMVDEMRVNAETSPLVYNKNESAQWLDKNFISFLMTGIDDSEFRPRENTATKKSRINGKIEYLEQCIKDAQEQLESLGDVSYISLTDDAFISNYRKRLGDISLEERELYEKKNDIHARLRELRYQEKLAIHLIARLNNLRESYAEDLERLNFINVGSSLITQLRDVECPFCGSQITGSFNYNNGKTEYFKIISNDYHSTYAKLIDLETLISTKENEARQIETEIYQLNKSVKEIDKDIESLRPNIEGLKSILATAEENLKRKFQHADLEKEISEKQSNVEVFKKILSAIKNEKQNQREEITNEFLNIVKDNLVLWNFIENNVAVKFDYQSFDIIIDERKRSSYGKGNRSITFTAVMVALLDYCHLNNRPFSRLLIIDSPICTKYDGKQTVEDKISERTIDAFANYCNSKEWDFQFVVIDNKFTEQIDIHSLHNINVIDLEERGGLFF